MRNIEGAKSMHMRLVMNTVDSRVSPMIDGQRSSVILTSNRVNNVVDNYATNRGVKTFKEDPTACQYVSKEMLLRTQRLLSRLFFLPMSMREQKSEHFTLSITLLVLNQYSTYSLVIQTWTTLEELLIAQENTGLSDGFVTKSNIEQFDNFGLDFREYTFTMDNLPTFNNYRIKLLLTSNNSQAFVPLVRDLRVIALA